jgi:hypothetical protein
MMYAKMMPSPITKGKVIVSIFHNKTWMGFAKRMNEESLDFTLACKDLASAWEFTDHTKVNYWIVCMQNLGLTSLEPVLWHNNEKLTEL